MQRKMSTIGRLPISTKQPNLTPPTPTQSTIVRVTPSLPTLPVLLILSALLCKLVH